jgi:putative Mg2+ transporter-C (MgtC) family protein
MHRGITRRRSSIAVARQNLTSHGRTTAASLWATGAIGVSVGLGSYDVAVTVAVFTFLTLRLLTLVKEESDLKDGGKSDRKTDTRSD